MKILGVIVDTRLKYKQHIARAASKGLEAALELTRLKGLSTAAARQLVSGTVAPVVDYASNIWMHAYTQRQPLFGRFVVRLLLSRVLNWGPP